LKKFKKIIWAVLNLLHLAGPIQLIFVSSLREKGWFKSFRKKQAIDKDGGPIPWCSYPFIKFIEPRLSEEFDVFEFGSGNSTIWYASRVNFVKSVEHDQEWYNYVKNKLPANTDYVYRKLEYGGNYCNEPNADNRTYHIIIIDGRDRNNCVNHSIDNLSKDGVIIFDNANLQNYNIGVDALTKNNFRRIDFWGLSPVTIHETCTTIFYREQNCLNI
jgi:hypothetical protein